MAAGGGGAATEQEQLAELDSWTELSYVRLCNSQCACLECRVGGSCCVAVVMERKKGQRSARVCAFAAYYVVVH